MPITPYSLGFYKGWRIAISLWWTCQLCGQGMLWLGAGLHLRAHAREVIHEAEAYARRLCWLCHQMRQLELSHRPCFKPHCHCECHRGLTGASGV